MSFLLDTNIVSEARKGKRANVEVVRWLSTVEHESLYLSVLVVGEIRQGIERLRRRDPIQAGHLENWLAELRRYYADRMLLVDEEICEEWGRINTLNSISSRDSLMGATTKVQNMTFATRNTADVERSGVRLLNPLILLIGLTGERQFAAHRRRTPNSTV